MLRKNLLNRLGYTIPNIKKKRVIVVSDIAAEADDQFAVVHHLLTPSEKICGIIAANFEWRYRTISSLKEQRYTSMEKSYEEGIKILNILDIEDIPIKKGAIHEIQDINDLPNSEGADFIIKEAMKDDESPLFIAIQSGVTDLVIAYLKEPKIASKITAVWIGGGEYPQGGKEPNLQQDILAAKKFFESPIPLWQIPNNIYSGMHIAFSELMTKVRPNGEIGKYLAEEMFKVNDFYGSLDKDYGFPHGESWSLGDQPTVSVLLQNPGYKCWHTEKVDLNDDMTYSKNPKGKEIRVYDSIDKRFTLDDFYEKLKLCFGK